MQDRGLGQPLPLEVYVSGGVVSGVTRRVEARRRLVDVLNGADGVFQLESAVITAAGTKLEMATVQIDKRSIVLAVPHETPEHIRLRAVMSVGISAAQREPVQVAMLAGPYFVRGTAFLPQTATRAELDASLLPRFFPLANAQVSLPDGTFLEAPLAIVNRDLLAGIGRIDR